MSATSEMSSVSPGGRAPDFALPAVDGSGTITLQDYRGKSPLFLGTIASHRSRSPAHHFILRQWWQTTIWPYSNRRPNRRFAFFLPQHGRCVRGPRLYYALASMCEKI